MKRLSIMSKIILVSFADSRFSNSLKRLKEQTKDFPFDERYFLTEKTCLTKQYWRNLKPWLYRRGFGYWSWKPSIVKECLAKMDDGDILFWMDAGLYWNNTPSAHKRFSEYVSMLNGENDLLAFEQVTVEQEWTKGDVLDTLGIYDNKEICENYQYYGGIFMIKKSIRICQLFDKLESLYDISKELITDKRSSIPNKPGFKEHRHDQSIFSCLVKQYPHADIPWTEVLPEKDGDWALMRDYPIQGRRLKEQDRPKREMIKNKLLKPWRMILDVYFKKFRDYEYKGNYAW